MRLLAAIQQIQSMGHESCQPETEHYDAADPAAAQQAPQFEDKSDEIARQKADDGHVQHESPSMDSFSGDTAVRSIIAGAEGRRSGACRGGARKSAIQPAFSEPRPCGTIADSK